MAFKALIDRRLAVVFIVPLLEFDGMIVLSAITKDIFL
jgi:hypothetical protein